ncbi:MAG: magnesium transporter [Gemmatimonadetes bacterium]|nr:magnesium transporter [Gemmatimonadota bacterium]
MAHSRDAPMAASAPDLDQPAAHQRLRELVAAGDLGSLSDLLPDLHPSDVADVLGSLEEHERVTLIRALPIELASEALAEMDEHEERGDLLAALAPEQGAELLQELEDDDAAGLIADLEPAEQRRILSRLSDEEAGDIRELLLFEEETAGRLMTASLVSIRVHMTAEQAIAEVRRQGREVEDFYSVFVVDEDNVLQGTVALDRLVLADPATQVAALVEPPAATVSPDVDQEEVGRLMSRYNLVNIAVVEESGELIGRITFDDVIDVIEAEQTEDLFLLAGVSDEEVLRGTWQDAVRTRLPWLAINLVTAFMAASVVLVFGRIIDSIWFIAAVMPIIAGMGGNSGTQSLAVTVRRIAMSRGTLEKPSDAFRKETIAGLVNGLAIGLLTFGVAWIAVAVVPDVSPRLPWVVLMALWGNMVVGASMGALIPTVLNRMGTDPAIASSVFLTTFTDMIGFVLLLWLASALML